jgi:hypothetical protein
MRRTAPQGSNATSGGPSSCTEATSGRAQSPVPGAGGGMMAGGGGALNPGSQEYPMNAHLKWVLGGAAGLLQCVHGLAAAESAGLLGPLKASPNCR